MVTPKKTYPKRLTRAGVILGALLVGTGLTAVAAPANATQPVSGPATVYEGSGDGEYSGCAATFPDVPRNYKFFNEIEWMYQSKLTTGVKTSRGVMFNPKTSLTREAMAAFLYRQNAPKGWSPAKASPFKDVKPGHQFYKPILWMYESGLSTGIKTSSGLVYKPKASLTREAMAAFFYRMYAEGYSAPTVARFADVPKNHKFYAAISWMRDSGTSTGSVDSNGNRTYSPSAKLTREALAAFMYRQAGAPSDSRSCLQKWANDEFGTFEQRTITGRGTQVVAAPASAGIMEVRHSGQSNFIVWSLDGTNHQRELIVNEIGNYHGVAGFGLEDRNSSKRFQVEADGSWELTFKPVSSAPRFRTSGNGDAVMLYDGAPATMRFTHDGEDNFIVEMIGSEDHGWDLLVNEIGVFDGTVAVPGGPGVYIVDADGHWTINRK